MPLLRLRAVQPNGAGSLALFERPLQRFGITPASRSADQGWRARAIRRRFITGCSQANRRCRSPSVTPRMQHISLGVDRCGWDSVCGVYCASSVRSSPSLTQGTTICLFSGWLYDTTGSERPTAFAIMTPPNHYEDNYVPGWRYAFMRPSWQVIIALLATWLVAHIWTGIHAIRDSRWW